MTKTALQALIDNVMTEQGLMHPAKFVQIARTFLPKDREQIEAAYNQACIDIGKVMKLEQPIHSSASDYYNKTYGE